MNNHMNAKQHQMYDLGRQANRAGFKLEACNLSHYDPNRAWWVAGWHDEDMERGQKEDECRG